MRAILRIVPVHPKQVARISGIGIGRGHLVHARCNMSCRIRQFVDLWQDHTALAQVFHVSLVSIAIDNSIL